MAIWGAGCSWGTFPFSSNGVVEPSYDQAKVSGLPPWGLLGWSYGGTEAPVSEVQPIAATLVARVSQIYTVARVRGGSYAPSSMLIYPGIEDC